MGSLEGRVALITGGARGQGRTHAVALAREGVDVVLGDRCEDAACVPYALARQEDLDETARLVEAAGRTALAARCDVRDPSQVDALVSKALEQFGRIDILLANAGISPAIDVVHTTPDAWDEVLDTNLSGVFNAIRAVAPTMMAQGSGRIVATSSMLGRSAAPSMAAYCASKWGVIGLVKSAAQDLAAHGITVNAVAPGNVSTPMVHNDALYHHLRPDLEHPTSEDVAPILQQLQVIPVPWFEPEEVTNAVLFLVGDQARYITGAVIDISAGASARFTA